MCYNTQGHSLLSSKEQTVICVRHTEWLSGWSRPWSLKDLPRSSTVCGWEPPRFQQILVLNHTRRGQSAGKDTEPTPLYKMCTSLDHTVAHLKTRFPPELAELAGALLAAYLLPGNLTNLSQEIECELIKEFEPFIPCSSSFLSELSTWRVYLAEPDDYKGSDLVSIACFADNNRVPEHSHNASPTSNSSCWLMLLGAIFQCPQVSQNVVPHHYDWGVARHCGDGAREPWEFIICTRNRHKKYSKYGTALDIVE